MGKDMKGDGAGVQKGKLLSWNVFKYIVPKSSWRQSEVGSGVGVPQKDQRANNSA